MTEIPDIDNNLRRTMNAALAYLSINGLADATRADVEAFLIGRMRVIGAWPNSPRPEAFPFIDAIGEHGSRHGGTLRGLESGTAAESLVEQVDEIK